MHDKSGLMIAQMSQDNYHDYCLPPRAAWTKVEGVFIVFARNATQTVTVCKYLLVQKHVIFSGKMNIESESFSPTESVKHRRPKVMQSKIKEGSRWALHLFFSFWLTLETCCCCSELFANSLFCITRSN